MANDDRRDALACAEQIADMLHERTGCTYFVRDDVHVGWREVRITLIDDDGEHVELFYAGDTWRVVRRNASAALSTALMLA